MLLDLRYGSRRTTMRRSSDCGEYSANIVVMMVVLVGKNQDEKTVEQVEDR
jgi:hypothetical protein